tara:strand:- start:5869 stop:6144 length:276 start_codon:yes stop_codon:yes gene_type:complete
MTKSKVPLLFRDNIKKIAHRILLFFCITPVLIDLLFLDRKSYFVKSAFVPIDGWVSFYAIFGFMGCGLLIFVGRLLSKLLKASETYYNDDF